MQLRFPKTAIVSSACLMLSLLAVTPANAKSPGVQSLTNFTKNDPSYSEGKLMRCALQFSTIFVDESLQGRAFFAEGSVGFFFTKGDLMFVPFTKAAVSERIDNRGQISASPLPIANAVVFGDNGINSAMFESINLPSPTNSYAILSKFRMRDRSDTRDFFEITTSSSLALAFTMKETGKRYEIPVDLTLAQIVNGKEVHSNDAAIGFTNCMLEMIKIAKANNKR